MNPYDTIKKYFDENSLGYDILIKHSELVTKKAIQIAKYNLEKFPDLDLIKTGAMLHDIGICKTNAKNIGCFGQDTYLKHFLYSKEIVKEEGYSKEIQNIVLTHIGCGCTVEEIEKYKFPFPKEDIIAKTVEEQIVAIADLYFSKNINDLEYEKTIDEIRQKISKYTIRQKNIFEKWIKKYKLDKIPKL